MKNTTVLYIDDDPDDLTFLQEAFQEVDPTYTILQASDGEEGLQTLQKLQAANHLPCLIVLDINMPKMCGRKTFERIRENSSLAAIPIVVFSTSTNPNDRAFFDSPNVAYLIKPVNFSKLIVIVKQLISICER